MGKQKKKATLSAKFIMLDELQKLETLLDVTVVVYRRH
jgi:hypothetical protein